MHALLRPVAALPLAAALAVGTLAALLIGAGTLVVPSAAHAQRAAAPARPQIERLEIGSDAGLAPGAELELRRFGTPRGTASVRISAAKTINVVLKESPAGSGEYVAYYTIKPADRLAAGQAVRATLRRGKLTNSASYTSPASAGDGTPPPAATLRIDSFATAPVPRPSPGTERVFTVQGAPGAQASFDINGIAANLRPTPLATSAFSSCRPARRARATTWS